MIDPAWTQRLTCEQRRAIEYGIDRGPMGEEPLTDHERIMADEARAATCAKPYDHEGRNIPMHENPSERPGSTPPNPRHFPDGVSFAQALNGFAKLNGITVEAALALYKR